MNRVAITGQGIISPIGNHTQDVWEALTAGRSGIVSMPQWEGVKDLKVKLAGVCGEYNPKRLNRKNRRTMGPMTVMAALSALDALEQAGISEDAVRSGKTGVAMGSTTGSGGIIQTLFDEFSATGGISRLEGTAFMKIMN